MRVLAFTPFGGTKFMVPNAIDLQIVNPYKVSRVTAVRAGGAFDNFGDTSPLDIIPFEFPFVYPCPNRWEYDNVFAAFTARGWLDIQMTDGTVRSILFKAESVTTERKYEARSYIPFVVKGTAEPYWRSMRQRILTGSGTPFTITTLGNAPVFTQMTIVLSGQTGSIASFTLSNTTNGYSIAWTGGSSLGVGETITINPGACTVVRSTGTDEYPTTTVGNSGSQVGFFKLNPGANAITVSPALPAGSIWTFTFRDAWL